MDKPLSIEELSRKVKQQEDTIVQLVRIIASTNHRVSELQVKQEELEKYGGKFQQFDPATHLH